MKVLGCDPGARTSAVVVRDGKDCLHVELVERGDTFEPYFEAVLDACMFASAKHKPELSAVEGVVKPVAHLGMTDVEPLLETAQLVGALRVFGFRVVRPAGFGRVPDDLPPAALKAYMTATYPAELLGPRETSYGGALRHARSAWDCAGAAVVQTRQQALFGGVR